MTARQDLKVTQGADFTHVHTVRDSAGAAIDLSGYSARSAVRISLGEGVGNVVLLSTGADADGGTLALGGAAGTVTFTMTAEQTTELYGYIGIPPRPVERLVYFIYDLELVTGSGVVTRPIEGRLILSREVTQ